ncbi:MAG: hypothetical protein AAF196_19115 [Planctomycetota bacterium]
MFRIDDLELTPVTFDTTETLGRAVSTNTLQGAGVRLCNSIN